MKDEDSFSEEDALSVGYGIASFLDHISAFIGTGWSTIIGYHGKLGIASSPNHHLLQNNAFTHRHIKAAKLWFLAVKRSSLIDYVS